MEFMISPEIFIMQADRICHELFEQFSDNIFSKIELKQYEPEDRLLSDEFEMSFYNMLKRDQLASELNKEAGIFSISEGFIAEGKLIFFIICINSEEKRNYEKYHSFFDMLIEQLFAYFTDAFKADNTYFYNGSTNSIITRNAIDALVTEISRNCCQHGSFSLYDNINLTLKNILGELASATYEKSSAEGYIYFTGSLDDVDFQFRFKDYKEYGNFDLKNIRLLRKLLELTSIKNGIGIISDTNAIYGIGRIKKDAESYSVAFDDDRTWTVYENDNELISIRNNTLIFVSYLISKREFTNYAAKVFPEKKDSEDIGTMYNIMKTLVKQEKGTILVIKHDAESFIKKYEDLCMVIEPVKLDEKNVEKLSSIDGAIIMDENCICYGFGAVLDGLDTGFGNRGRGARYNSSERFYNLYKNETDTDLMVFILSDDGNYNFFPEI